MTGLTEQARAVGIAWYRAQDYGQIRQIMIDADDFPATYREWRQESELRESDLKRLGHDVLRAIVDPEVFQVWCRARGLSIDANARARFVNEIVRRQVWQTG